jgi:hypothetical protein
MGLHEYDGLSTLFHKVTNLMRRRVQGRQVQSLTTFLPLLSGSLPVERHIAYQMKQATCRFRQNARIHQPDAKKCL